MVSPLVGRDEELRIIDDVLFGRVTGVVLVGRAGVGKTALLDAAHVRAVELGMTAHRIRGTPEVATIPFGAVAHLLPDDHDHDRLSILRAIERTLLRTAGDSGVALLVDDAGELDPATLAALHRIAAGGGVRFAVAVTAGERVRPTLTRLWKDGLARRVQLQPLRRVAALELAERLVGGPITDDTECRLWELTGGHPLHVRAIVDGTTLTTERGLRRFATDPLDAPQLTELVTPRLADLSRPARRALASLATAGALAPELYDCVVGPDVAAELESRQLLAVVDGSLVPSDPLLAALALRACPSRERRAVAADLADAMWSRGEPTGDDLVDAVTWQLASGRSCEPATVLAAARHALDAGDYRGAAELATTAAGALGDEESWRGWFVLGQALRLLGERAAADRAFEHAMSAREPADRVDVAVARAHNIGIAAGRIDEALLQLADVAADVSDARLQRRVAIERTFLSSLVGDFRTAADAASEVLASDDLDDATALSAATANLFASVMLLRLGPFDETFERFLATARRLEGTFPLAVDQFELIDAVASIVRGRIGAALDACARRRRHGSDASRGCGDGAWSAVETFALSFTTAPRVTETARRSIRALRSLDPLGLRFVGSGLAALALAQTGAIDDASRAWARAQPVTEGDRRSGRLIAARLTAWRAAYAGDTATAARLVREAAREAVDHGHLLWGSLGLHDAVRFGHTDHVIDDLRALRDEVDEPVMRALPGALVGHAEAAAGPHAGALVDAADRFARLGATALAVEAALEAGERLVSVGDIVPARRVVARAQVLAGGSLPPTPRERRTPPALTDRQAEVVGRVLDGRTGPQIAHELSLSVRTVENHVAAVYRQLELSSRNELVQLLTPATDASDPGEER